MTSRDVSAATVDLPGLVLHVDGIPSPGIIDLATLFSSMDRVTGASAELSLPGATGGGYLSKDAVTGDLRGVVSADLALVRVTGLAVFDADGQSFSLIVLLAAEFQPALQLSFGFTLVGVGGILGINRGADRNAIAASVRSGDVSRLLFPRDPVAEAPRLLATLDACFPKRRGGMVVGPLVKLGWGTPTIISATVGVIVSTSDSAVIIIGRLALSLPFESAPLIHLEATFDAYVDASGFSLGGTLTNSRLVGIPVEGDLMAVMRTGPRAAFAVSVGGFHPGFPVPDGMPGMRRFGTSLSPNSMLSLRLEAYAAVTPSSLQFGARAELRAMVGGFGVSGHFKFDTFFYTEPEFGFMATADGSVSIVCADISVAAIRLEGAFSGPTPWRFRGSASFTWLLIEYDVVIPEIVWGDRKGTALPLMRYPFDVLDEVVRRPGSWMAAATGIPHVVVLGPGVSEDRSALHPLSSIEFRQREIPLDTEMAKFEGHTLPQPVTASLTADGATPLHEPFRPSQILDMPIDRQLESASFLSLPAGFRIDPEPRRGVARDRRVQYEQKILGLEPVGAGDRFRDSPLGFATAWSGHTPPDRAAFVTVREVDPTIVTTSTMHEVGAAAPDTGLSPADAFQILEQLGSRDLQVVAAWEIGVPS